MPHPANRVGTWARLVQQGQIEAVFAALLAVFSATIHLASGPAWQPLVLDLAACVAAAASGKWPRAAGAALGVVLLVYLVVPAGWATLGEYSAFIPILGAGLRGSRHDRLVVTVFYLPLLCAITWLDAPNATRGALAGVFWAVAIGVLWVIGNVFAATVAAQQLARTAELLKHRQTLARGLHDTVARSLTRVTMAAERARLRGSASDAELATISESAMRAAEELRLVMLLLREPTPTQLDNLAPAASLQQALADAEQDLTKHGFSVSFSIEGQLNSLNKQQGDALGVAVGEAAGNIIKHGEPETACVIFVGVSETDAELVFVNRRRPGAAHDSRPTSMGLDNIRQTLMSVGGELFTEAHPDQWITRIQLPLQGVDRLAQTASTRD